MNTNRFAGIFRLFVVLSIVALLAGCGGGGGGGGGGTSGGEESKPPTAVAGPDQTVDEAVLVTLDGSASTDPDDGIASYAWQQTAGAVITLTNPNTANPTFTTPQVGEGGASYTFELTVTDKGGLQSTDSCIVNVTWKNDPPKAEAGPDQTVENGSVVTLDGSGSLDPDDEIASYVWQQIDGPFVTLSGANTAAPQFTASVAVGSILTFNLTVTDNRGLSASDTCMVTVQGAQQITEDVLYTAYAGIGYGRADYTSTDDDEFLYNVMLDDLNSLAGNLVLDTIFNDPGVLGKLINLALGFTTTFTYTDSYGVISRIEVNPGALVHGYVSFVADLSVNFSSTAYPWEKCQYYGADGGIDLTASVTGYYKATTAGLEELFLSMVTIVPKNTLKAVYPKGEVRYNNWKIEYQVYYGDVDPTYTKGMSTIPVNMKVAPTLISPPPSDVDFRDYDLSGGFTLNNNAYVFGTASEVVNYQQEQESGQTLIFIAGKLKVPGLTGQVTISTPTGNPIMRNTTGLWTSGQMNFAGMSSALQVSFLSNGSCLFSGGNLGDWSVDTWQNTLEP